MKSIIVEKIVIMNGDRKELFALATPEPIPQSVCYSLTFEAHLTPWVESRDVVETLAKHQEAA